MSRQLVRVKNDPLSIQESAKSISLAFSSDPLIKWLRPNAPLWSTLDSASTKWQCRRVRREISEQSMLRLSEETPNFQEHAKQSIVSTKSIGKPDYLDQEYGAVAILKSPPNSGPSWFQQWISKVTMWLLDTFDPAEDQGASLERVKIMSIAHDEAMDEVKKHLHPLQPWYLEVVAVRPSLHGKGYGGQLMRAILELVGDQPIVLTCTDSTNVGFYKKYGFEEVKTLSLEDNSQPSFNPNVPLYFMLRKGA